MNGIEQLCPNCGLCCDSTLFADVELRAADNARRLKKLGLVITRKTPAKRAFAQPCGCFDGKLCRIYADRPMQCRKFACGLLKRVEAGEMTAGAALKKIRAAKARAGRVRTLLKQSGQRDDSMALTQRYAEAMSAPVDLSAANAGKAQGQLMRAMNDLMAVLLRDFLK